MRAVSMSTPIIFAYASFTYASSMPAECAIVIEHPQGRILHHGSAGFVPGALDGQRADVVFLGIAMIGDLEPYLRETVDAVGASRVIPVHWDNFTLPLDKPLEPFPFVVRLDDFFANMRRLRPAIQVQTLLPVYRKYDFEFGFGDKLGPGRGAPDNGVGERRMK